MAAGLKTNKMKASTGASATPESKTELTQDNGIHEIDSISLDEVVVTGQGAAIKRRRLSSNVTTVSSAMLANRPADRFDQLLQSELPGMQILISDAQPGTTSMFKSRGLSSAFINSTPVIYVDGVRVDNLNTGATLGADHTLVPTGQAATSGSIGDIPMENIDHVEYVSGGAATTLYGSDAANGVIQIFTKKGGNGFHATATAELGVNDATSQFYFFDRTKELLNQHGLMQRYRLTMEGGTERLGYSFGASMSENNGIVIHNNNRQRKYDIRFGTHARINRMFEYQNSFGFTNMTYNRSRNGNEGFYSGLWFTECGYAGHFTYTDQNGQVRNFDPNIDALDGHAFGQIKALVDRAEALQDDHTVVRRYQTSHSFELKPIEELSFRGTIGLDYRTSEEKDIIQDDYLDIDKDMRQYIPSGTIYNTDRKYFGLTLDINGQWKKYFEGGMSNILTAGFQFFNTYDHQTTLNGIGIRKGARIISGAGTITGDEWLSKLHNEGFYAQDNFGWRDRYYFDLGVRIDNNSAFGNNVGWQAYPKVGMSYIMSEEKFFDALRPLIGTLRLFANYGVAGSYPPAFAYQKTIAISSYQGKQAATFGNYGNPDLGPERKHAIEAGFNMSMLAGRLNIGATYYYTRTKDAIFNVPTLPSSGQKSTYLANVGDIMNQGVELTLDGEPIRMRAMSLKLRASLNTNHNRVMNTGGVLPFQIGGFGSTTIQTVVAQGKPVGFLRGNKAVMKADGTLDHVESNADLGTTLPSIYGSFGLDFSWRRLNVYASGDYQVGGHVHSFDAQFRFLRGLPSPDVPATAYDDAQRSKSWLKFTNFFVYKADFAKVRNIGADYTFLFHNLPVESLNVALNVYNPFCFTACPVDPEASLSGAIVQGAATTAGLNYATYSSPRQYVMTLKVTF